MQSGGRTWQHYRYGNQVALRYSEFDQFSFSWGRWVLVAVSRRLKEAFDRQAQSLARSVRDAVRGAEDAVCGLFANAPLAVDTSLGVIVNRATGTGESARPELFRRILRVEIHKLERPTLGQGPLTFRGKDHL